MELGALTVKAIEKGISLCLEFAAKSAKSNIAERLREANIEKKQWQISRHIHNLQYIRTLFSATKNTSILNFYYPTTFEDPDAGTLKIDSVDELERRNYVITGTAGQGKSIFARYISLRQARDMSDGRIPLFIELRKLDASNSFSRALEVHFAAMGLVEREVRSRIKDEASLGDVMGYMFGAGRCLLILDGFDEVASLSQPIILREIEEFCEKYPETQVVVTTRPDTPVCYSSQFHPLPIRPLGTRDLRPFVSRLISDDATVESIVKAVHRSEFRVADVLSTPLMMTLLCVLYLSTQSVPKSLIDFYENIFSVLMFRHDVTKSGYKRERFARYQEADLAALFWAICFVTRAEEKVSINYDDWSRIVSEARELSAGAIHEREERSRWRDVDSDGLRKEATKNLCILVEEGLELSFVHKSVQEFLSAKFVRSSDEEFAHAFYGNLSREGGRQWSGELSFLRKIDAKRYARLLWLPEFERFCIRYKLSQIPDSKEVWRSAIRADDGPASFRGMLDQFALGFWLDEKQLEKSGGLVRIDEVDFFVGPPESEMASTLFKDSIWSPTAEWLIKAVGRGDLTARDLAPYVGNQSKVAALVAKRSDAPGKGDARHVFWIAGYDIATLLYGRARTEDFFRSCLEALRQEWCFFLGLKQDELRKLAYFGIGRDRVRK